MLYLFYQTGKKADGGVNSLLAIIEGLNNINVKVVTNLESEATNRLTNNGNEVTILPWPTGNRMTRAFGLARSMNTLARFIRENKVSVAHVNDIQTLQFSIWVLKAFKIPTLFNIRGVIAGDKDYKHTWSIVNLTHRVIVLSESMREQLLSRLPLFNRKKWESKFEVIYSIVKVHKFFPEILPEVKKGRKDLLVSAIFSELKNQKQFILNALPELVQCGYRVHFVGDNDSDYAKECRDIVVQRGWGDSVCFHGYQSNMAYWYNYVFLTVVPSTREGLSRSMIESLACGTPVVSFDVSSAHEILTEYRCGSVVKQGDYDGLVRSVEQLTIDNALYLAYSENAVQTSGKLFSEREIIKSYESLYLELI